MIQDLLKQYKEYSLMGAISSLMHWDMETMMPSGAGELRSEMMALISQLAHRQISQKSFVEKVMQLDPQALSGEEKRQAQLLKVAVMKQNAFTEEFVARATKIAVTTHEKWKEARKQKDFSIVLPHLKAMVDLKREEAQLLQANPQLKSYFHGRTKYETLMDDFEPEFSSARIRKLLAELKSSTLELLPKVLEKVSQWPNCPEGTFAMPIEKQRELGELVSKELGLDYSRARLDTSAHPFCTNFNKEIRITTRHDPQDFLECLLGVIHETGHALYEQSLPMQWNNTPMGSAVSMGVHESQSRFMENMIARSKPFSRYLSKKTGLNSEIIFQQLNRVQRSFIRTEADELTYNLHIILRMNIEEDLIEGKLEVADLPASWNKDFEAMIGLKVPDDSLGCMQDTHWFGGGFGYFPTYSLGNLLAAELFADFQKELPDWENKIEQGDFSAVRGFLDRKIHCYGSSLNSTQLMQKTLGRELGIDSFVKYIRGKFEV